MPYKNDDFEELFEKAGNDYPLRTDSSDWDMVAVKLSAASNRPTDIKARLLKYALLLLLLLTSSIIFNEVQHYASEVAQNAPTAKQLVNSTKVREKPSGLTTNNSTVSENMETDLSFNGFDLSWKQNRQVELAKPSDESSSLKLVGATATIDSNFPASYSSKPGQATVTPVEDIKQNTETTEIIGNDKILDPLYEHKAAEDSRDPANAQSAARQVVKFRPSPTKFYGTIYASPQFSTVKFQKINDPGYSIGVALGYSINPRLDIEIGLQRERINFYSDGKYFERKALRIKSEDAVLDNIEGHSKVTNVPITLRYNFASRNNGHFYAAAGVNALQITHTENYEYLVLKNGRERDHSKRYSSVSDPKYFTGIIAGGGYEVKVCNWLNMKAEPYFQVPIRQFGVGQLPVTNFGVNIGIVKRLK